MSALAFAAAFVAWLSVLLAAFAMAQHAPAFWPAGLALVAIGAAMVSHGAGIPSADKAPSASRRGHD